VPPYNSTDGIDINSHAFAPALSDMRVGLRQVQSITRQARPKSVQLTWWQGVPYHPQLVVAVVAVTEQKENQ